MLIVRVVQVRRVDDKFVVFKADYGSGFVFIQIDLAGSAPNEKYLGSIFEVAIDPKRGNLPIAVVSDNPLDPKVISVDQKLLVMKSPYIDFNQRTPDNIVLVNNLTRILGVVR